ncbi:hypothetical protein EHQ96_00940 [Leptospira levettii]|nr:hypothetical protein EHQ96_00940 [Leptospira levettii]TGM83502.1 hypothetical protein EHR00_10525 [Leptospira levettii]TGM93312.1 hypothetical protein EHR02_11230 [Leptospira levettii]
MTQYWILFFIFVFCFDCSGRQKNQEYITLDEPAIPIKSNGGGFAKKYGYQSECLVLMEGPVPSRLEPCVIGDVRSASMMYKETEVTVSGETAQFEWQMTGMVYSPFVNETYYQNAILYRGSFFRKSDIGNYRRSPYPTIVPYLTRPSYHYPRHGYYRYGR